ncbi:hypothetical protein FB45DRAFT_997157 [Roridomyces roridus]|uniref:Uncharacterized protein n=1 Tax=Roridomyces roridus TaxID=1738132 RepID=A0AAD7CIG9_9AGAR|nr:hypothetical protein FB45DRAFT_997157 [Roridomyces roridus]
MQVIQHACRGGKAGEAVSAYDWTSSRGRRSPAGGGSLLEIALLPTSSVNSHKVPIIRCMWVAAGQRRDGDLSSKNCPTTARVASLDNFMHCVQNDLGRSSYLGVVQARLQTLQPAPPPPGYVVVIEGLMQVTDAD